MRVFRTALLATGFVLAGLAACQTRHKPIVQVNYDDFTATEFTDCKQTKDWNGDPLIVCDSHSDWLTADGQPVEPAPEPRAEWRMMLQGDNEIYAEPVWTPTPTPADLGDTGCDAAHAGRRNIDMEGSEWRCLWVLADKNSPAKQYRWAQVAASPLPSPTPTLDWSREHCPPDVILESGRAMSLSSETSSNPNYATYCGYGMGPH